MVAAAGAGEGGHEGFGGDFGGGEVGGGVVAAERERVDLLGGHFFSFLGPPACGYGWKEGKWLFRHWSLCCEVPVSHFEVFLCYVVLLCELGASDFICFSFFAMFAFFLRDTGRLPFVSQYRLLSCA